jgi:hypothetical protein
MKPASEPVEPAKESGADPQRHPAGRTSGAAGEPRFGLLLAVLAGAIAVIIAIVFASAAWFDL